MKLRSGVNPSSRRAELNRDGRDVSIHAQGDGTFQEPMQNIIVQNRDDSSSGDGRSQWDGRNALYGGQRVQMICGNLCPLCQCPVTSPLIAIQVINHVCQGHIEVRLIQCPLLLIFVMSMLVTRRCMMTEVVQGRGFILLPVVLIGLLILLLVECTVVAAVQFPQRG